MPRPWITQGPVVAPQPLSDAIIAFVKLRGGRVSKYDYDGYPKGWIMRDKVTGAVSAPALDSHFRLRLVIAYRSGLMEYDVSEDGFEGEINSDKLQNEIYDCFIEWADKVMPAKKPSLFRRLKKFFLRGRS